MSLLAEAAKLLKYCCTRARRTAARARCTRSLLRCLLLSLRLFDRLERHFEVIVLEICSVSWLCVSVDKDVMREEDEVISDLLDLFSREPRA